MTGYGVPQDRDWNRTDDSEFRALVRQAFAGYPAHLRSPSRRLLWREQSAWWLQMATRGWIAPNWPQEFGGMGLDSAKLLIFHEEQERAGIARFQDHGVRMVGPTLFRFGTKEQQRRFLPAILTCDHRYAQGYSEPGSGSDLASLRTRAVRGGDDWVVTGTKIWTTMAHDVTHLFLLARTSTDGRPQQQISFFLLDLSSPGVTIRTIRDMAGEEELCEVFLDAVRIPAENLIGPVNEGWTVAKSVLGFERLHVGSPQLPESALHLLDRVVRARGLEHDPVFADQLAQLELDVSHLKAAFALFAAELRTGGVLGPEVSLLKLWATETFQRIADAVIESAGPAGALKRGEVVNDEEMEVLGAYYRARPSTIYGGTSEVQRNIIAKQVLKLPSV
ncbi:acyl-CoA dehydrogenase family protein [Streptomyces sp. NPDC048430]|uniref:acyl-CoA dehydrogenase family protein n=1 Tax=Streptomyces sp. NPDC048430 TaxID=3155388 RepID=UPI00343D5344